MKYDCCLDNNVWNNLKVKFSIKLRVLSAQCRLFCSWEFKLIYFRRINHNHRLMIHFKFSSPFGSDRCNWFVFFFLVFFSSYYVYVYVYTRLSIYLSNWKKNQYEETMALWYCNFIKIWFRWKCLQGEQMDKLPIVSPKQIWSEKEERKKNVCGKRIESDTFIN